jgi:hypothetical protein
VIGILDSGASIRLQTEAFCYRVVQVRLISTGGIAGNVRFVPSPRQTRIGSVVGSRGTDGCH